MSESDLFCLHCGRDQTVDELSENGECAACAFFSLQEAAIDYSGAPLSDDGCGHCGCYFNNGDDCCRCGANLNDASR